MTETGLYTWTRADLMLAEALASMGIEPAVALVYTPSACRFAIPGPAGLQDVDGRQVALDQVFEVRCFAAGGELRWLRDADGAGAGRAVYVSEVADGPEGWAMRRIDGLIGETNHYLLWGQVLAERADGTRPPDGWVVLASARIGELPVPYSGQIAPGQGLRLAATEYLGPAAGTTGVERHGNWVVRAERLCGLDVYGPARATTGSDDRRPAQEVSR